MSSITGFELVQMSRTARIAHRHLTGMTREAMEDQLDQFVRAAILEGVTGAPDRSYSRNPLGAFRELAAQYPSIDPSWFEKRNQGIHKQLIIGAMKVLKHEAGTSTAEEVVQNLLGGIDPDGNKQSTPMLESMGKYHANAILNGSLDTGDAARKASAFAGKRALDEWRKSQRRKNILNGPQVGVGGEDGPAFDVEDAIKKDTLDTITSVLDSRQGREFKNWVYNVVARDRSLDPLAKAVAFVYMKNNGQMSDGAIGKSSEVMAANGGKAVSHTTVKNKFKLFTKAIRVEMAKSPKVVQWVMDALSVRGFYASAMKTAKLTAMSERVAQRWLDRTV